ncbi:hypothetical protein B2G52_05460 [Neisseria lactamica]|uniref:Uncharacterized protein n=1 Tax=Neisseria lactamica TaxID=486 RepID=A0AAU8VIS3_NEILA|nr:hypothetical protein B2G52_05460 [Neisseria lactamica]
MHQTAEHGKPSNSIITPCRFRLQCRHQTDTVNTFMFQHTGRHIKHRPMCRPDLEEVTPFPNRV